VAYTVSNKPLTNKAYGFPTRGNVRRIKPRVLAVVHITDNPGNQGPTAATNERNYANRPASPGPSAHFYINRDGSAVQAINYAAYAAWSNGDMNHPNTANAGVKYLVGIHNSGYNVNEGVAIEIELVGYAKTAGQPTKEQMEAAARLIAAESKRLGIKPTRSTILTHADINSVDRRNCAFLAASREAKMKILIARVIAIVKPPVVVPPPIEPPIDPPPPLELPKTYTATWTESEPTTKVTTITWTPAGFVISTE
jgi:hypothetical protein